MRVSQASSLYTAVAIFCFRVDAQQRVGSQSFQLNDTLGITGGRYVDEDGITLEQVPEFVSANLTLDFASTSGPRFSNLSQPANVPIVSNGFVWSNLVDRAWQYGGRPIFDNVSLSNDVWRIEMINNLTIWTLAHNDTLSLPRPSYGAGCNVQDLQRGYYLGGVAQTGNGTVYPLHQLAVFDMQNEILTTIAVPEYVPVVNQSLVFIDTETRQGALVALGGYVENNGTLTLAPMSSIYIFDIETQEWTVQPVTDLAGHTSDVEPQANGVNLTAIETFPSRRISACATVGSSQDKTSHNIFLAGGQNNVTALADAWVLSLPSAVWIRAQTNPDFAPNYPTAESSCLLLNSRFLFMLGGCLLDVNTHKPCMSYSSGPLNYDISLLALTDYIHSTLGYFVPQDVSAVVGGNTTGFANVTTPLFTSFANPLLSELFKPPHGAWLYGPFFYERLVEIMLILFLLIPFLCPLTYSFFKVLTRGRPQGKTQDSRPWTFSYTYLSFISCSTACLICLVIFLLWRSQQPDPLVEHWPGGPLSSGTWTGVPFASHFIRAPTYERPPRGLLSVYHDAGTNGVYNQKNSPQRLGPAVYWVFTYLPMLLAVLNGRMWKLVDDDVKRQDPYYRLQQHGGSPGARSLCLNYHAFWAPLSIVQALRFRHWSVAVSSTGNVLGGIVVPVLANYVFYWDVYSGAVLDYPEEYSWQVALVDTDWTWRLVGALAASEVCCLVLMYTLPKRPTGLTGDIKGIAGVVVLLEGADAASLDLPPDCSDWPLSRLTKHLAPLQFRLVKSGVAPRLERTNSSTSNSLFCGFGKVVSTIAQYRAVYSLRQCLNPLTRRLKDIANWLRTALGDSDTFFPFRRPVFFIWLAAISLLVVAPACIAGSLNHNAKNQLWNYQIPISPDVYLIAGILIQSAIDVIDHDARALTPLRALTLDFHHPRVLFTDPTLQTIPLYDALKVGYTLASLSALADLAVTVYTIFLGALQLSASAYGSTTFDSDLSAATACTLLMSFVLAVHFILGYCFSLRKPMLPRAPTNIGAMIPYVLFSDALRADVDGVAGSTDPVDELVSKGRRYGLGEFWIGGKKFVGVESCFRDGSAVKSLR